MKRLREDVDQFHRLRVIVTFKSGRTHMDIYGPHASFKKSVEIRTRVSRDWDFVWSKKSQSPHRDPDTVVQSIRYIIEILPSLGWYPQTDDTITAN